jgi:hypothetical protein
VIPVGGPFTFDGTLTESFSALRAAGRFDGQSIYAFRNTWGRTTGDIVLPGLVNTHGHAPMVLYRGLADDLALMEWLQKYIFPAEAKTVSPEMVRIGTRLAALEMIQSGTTTFTDMYYFEEEIAAVARDADCAACWERHHQVPRRGCQVARRVVGAPTRSSGRSGAIRSSHRLSRRIRPTRSRRTRCWHAAIWR